MPDREHYRELATRLRDVARQCRYPGARQEILDLASRYEVRANHLDARGTAAGVMASHGRHGISALVLGSETVKVLTHSKIPVLVHR